MPSEVERLERLHKVDSWFHAFTCAVLVIGGLAIGYNVGFSHGERHARDSFYAMPLATSVPDTWVRMGDVTRGAAGDMTVRTSVPATKNPLLYSPTNMPLGNVPVDWYVKVEGGRVKEGE